jgi:nucleoside diphosphate kinase
VEKMIAKLKVMSYNKVKIFQYYAKKKKSRHEEDLRELMAGVNQCWIMLNGLSSIQAETIRPAESSTDKRNIRADFKALLKIALPKG